MIFSLTISTGRHPLTGFSLLLLGQGFTLGMEFVDVVKSAWNRILSVPPFDDVLALDQAKQTISVYADQQAGDLGVEQFGASLDIPEAKRDNLRNYLGSTRLRVLHADGVTEEDAIRIWPEQGRVGRVGSLVAVLIKGDQPAELYQLTSTPRYPVPLVAVVTAGEHWGNVLVRAVAQTFAQLSDEFELPGAGFRRAPLTLVEPRPNVLVITDLQRTLLAAGARPQEVIGFPPGWGIDRKTPLTFHPHQGEDPDRGTSRRPNGRTQLVEGGAGYRFGVLRSDFDCLMRRQPSTAALPIQAAGVEFCRACWGALREQVNSWRDTNLGRRARILIDSQRPLCDTVRWGAVVPSVVPTASFDFQVGSQPAWACRVEPGSVQGLRLVNVRLRNRPGDPFGQVEEIFSRIEFNPPTVKFAGEQEQTLPFSRAFANTVEKPSLLVMTNSTSDQNSGGFLGAVRLALTWRIPGHWSVEAVLSVTFKDKNNDFDPGGAAIGNKLYPQVSLRYRRPPRSETGPLPKVDWLGGSIRLLSSNVFPTDLPVHADLHHFLTGTLQMTLATDSNASDWDNTYAWDQEDLSEVIGGCTGEAIPEWGVWGAEWQAGRLLATVIDPVILGLPDTLAQEFAGSVARRGHLTRNLPGLPHWSWLFDYVTPLSAGSRRFVAVYRRGERTAAGLDGGGNRELKARWPAGDEDYTMTVAKRGRQGAYDNVHIHPGMGRHGGREIVPAPFCADLCAHLHVRWGAVTQSGQLPGTPGAMDRPQFLGWGPTGRLDQGAHTTLGAPLVPPNQHVEIAVNVDTRSVSYEARAHDPDFDAFQVILEQGTGVLYTYGGLQIGDLANLAGALGLFNPRQIPERRRELIQLSVADPARFDRVVRVMFHDIYDRIRWYDTGLHDDVSADTQQVPDQLGPQRPLEQL